MINVTGTSLLEILYIVYTFLSLLGLVTMSYATIDNRRDLQNVKARGINSYSRLTASIGIWDSVAAGLFHVAFLSLGVLALTSPPPSPEEKKTSIVLILYFIALQMLILGVQVRNQIARLQIRRRLSIQNSAAGDR